MNSSDWQQAKELFERALDVDPEERSDFLRGACPDEGLRDHVEALLEQDGRSGQFLEPPERERVREAIAGPTGGLTPGEVIGGYEIRRWLGAGGMGRVYEAVQQSPRRTVALKIMNPGVASSSALRRFQFEAEILGRLQHPGIAQVYEAGLRDAGAAGEDPGVPFFAMEYVASARTLIEYARDRRLGIRQRVELFLRVCEAVHHGHQKGVIHRDLKPGNILVDEAGNPKIIDFGVARATDSDTVLTTIHTDVQQILGTLPYMSPEQLDGDPSSLDTRSDVYGLGVVLYELLCGSLPYEVGGEALHEAARIIREESPRRPSTDQPALKGDLDVILLAALEKDRRRRYDSVASLAADLRRTLLHEPIQARPPSVAYQLRMFARRHRALVGAMILVFLMGVVATVVSLKFALDARSAQEATAAQLEEVYRFSDAVLVQELIGESEPLWPRWPDRVPAMESWLTEADALLSRQMQHLESARRVEIELRSRELGSDQLGSEPLASASASRSEVELQWRLRASQELLAGLDKLHTLVDSVTQRRDHARQVRQQSIEEFAAEWEEALDEIFLSEVYDGLEMVPQLELAPLGPDPDSGLWEFWHLASGDRPHRDDASGQLTMTGTSGLVLVLIPGGTFTCGAQNVDRLGANYEPVAQVNEFVQTMTLDPFFLSKFEITQAQWKAMTGKNPSYRSEAELGQRALLHPVEEVNWHEAVEVLRRQGLALPTEAQWEYAARAGTTTPWWTGAAMEMLQGAANLAGAEYGRKFQGPRQFDRSLEDAFGFDAPVGSFRANPFGLHDVMGNVWEWCRDVYSATETPPRPGDGLRSPDQDSGFRVLKGGCFTNTSVHARLANRAHDPATVKTDTIGVRPVRALLTE